MTNLELVENTEDEEYDEAEAALDQFVFGNIFNHFIRGPLGDHYQVTFYGDNYLVLNTITGKMFPFNITINRGAEQDWDEEIKGQEWDVDYGG